MPQAGHNEHAGAPIHAAQGHGGHHEYKLGDIPSPWLLFSNALLVMLVILSFAVLSTRRLRAVQRRLEAAGDRPTVNEKGEIEIVDAPTGVQNVAELLVEKFVAFTRGVIGPGGEKHAPLVGTLFLFIYLSNVWGLIPLFHSPTANLSTTLALGLIVFFYVQYCGIRARGLKGYLAHFWGPIPLAGIILFPIELISEMVKPFTLAMRLFGNIFGEDTVIIVLATLGATMIAKLPFIPVQFPVLVLALLTTFVQALVFTLLTCIYLALQTHHEEHSHGGAEHAPS